MFYNVRRQIENTVTYYIRDTIKALNICLVMKMNQILQRSVSFGDLLVSSSEVSTYRLGLDG